jgi:hypothetical protein
MEVKKAADSHSTLRLKMIARRFVEMVKSEVLAAAYFVEQEILAAVGKALSRMQQG